MSRSKVVDSKSVLYLQRVSEIYRIWHRQKCRVSSANDWNLTLECQKFSCLALFAGSWFYSSLLSAVFSFVFAYALLTDDHVNNMCYFPFMSIKILVPYVCVLREGYYVILWLIVRICVFIKDWKLIYSALFILKRKSMDNYGGGSWHKLYSMHLPVKRTWFFCLALVPDVTMNFDLSPWPQFQGPKVKDYKSNPRPIGDRFVWVVRSNNTTHWATPIYCMPAFSRLSLVLDDLWKVRTYII
jgi:hypothetical protein